MNDLLLSLQPQLKHQTFSSGATLYYQSEIPRNAVIIKKGYVRAYTITANGDERTVALYTRNDILPISWIFGETKTTLFHYEAGSDIEVALIPKTVFIDAIAANQENAALLTRYLLKEHTAHLMRITALEQANAADKITFTLYYLLLRHGMERQTGSYTIDIKLTQSTIASLVGLTRESTATHIAKLKKNGVVSYKNFIYVIDRRKLEQLMGEDGFKDVTLK